MMRHCLSSRLFIAAVLISLFIFNENGARAAAQLQQKYFPSTNHAFVEYRTGNIPIIFVVAWGGTYVPDEIGTVYMPGATHDVGLTTTTSAIVFEFQRALGFNTTREPFLIASHLSPKVLKPLESNDTAAFGTRTPHPKVQEAYNAFHRSIEDAVRRATKEGTEPALLINLRTHNTGVQLGHKRVMIGTGITGVQLRSNDLHLTHLPNLAARQQSLGASLHDLIRGNFALGTSMAARGILAVPSRLYPDPESTGPPFLAGDLTKLVQDPVVREMVDKLQISLFTNLANTPSADWPGLSPHVFRRHFVSALMDWMENVYDGIDFQRPTAVINIPHYTSWTPVVNRAVSNFRTDCAEAATPLGPAMNNLDVRACHEECSTTIGCEFYTIAAGGGTCTLYGADCAPVRSVVGKILLLNVNTVASYLGDEVILDHPPAVQGVPPTLDPNQWAFFLPNAFDPILEYIPGDLPLGFVSLHGGRTARMDLAPLAVNATGTEYTNGLDTLVLNAYQHIVTATEGKRPYLVINHITPDRLNPDLEHDGVRQLVTTNQTESFAYPRAMRVFNEAKYLVSEISQQIAFLHVGPYRSGGAADGGLIVNFVQNALNEQRVELALGVSEVELSSSLQNAGGALTNWNTSYLYSAIAYHETTQDTRIQMSATDIIRGPSSLGSLLAARGVNVLPSACYPENIVDQSSYDGTGGNVIQYHSTRKRGAGQPGNEHPRPNYSDMIELSSYFKLLDDGTWFGMQRNAYAKHISGALLEFLETVYDVPIPRLETTTLARNGLMQLHPNQYHQFAEFMTRCDYFTGLVHTLRDVETYNCVEICRERMDCNYVSISFYIGRHACFLHSHCNRQTSMNRQVLYELNSLPVYFEPITSFPTMAPTSPTISPTHPPTTTPTTTPTVSPVRPTSSPTTTPTKQPTLSPSPAPTTTTTESPTLSPSSPAPTTSTSTKSPQEKTVNIGTVIGVAYGGTVVLTGFLYGVSRMIQQAAI